MNPQQLPTEGELGLLKALWELGPSTVRTLYEHVGPARGIGYTTVLKVLQIMYEKGLVERDDRSMAHIYRARVTAVRTERSIVTDVIDRVFDGSASKLMSSALGTKRATREEIAEMRRMLDALDVDE